jgi:hypothetical protein
VNELVEDAGKSRVATISQQAERKLHRLIDACVDTAATEMIKSAIEKYVLGGQDMYADKATTANSKQSLLLLPEKIGSNAVVGGFVVTPTAGATSTIATEEVVDIEDDDEIVVSTANEFLAELREEVVLQSLLHKRIHEKNERVFQLEHKNGRRLLVVLPPDTQSVTAF